MSFISSSFFSLQPFRPRLLDSLKIYRRADFIADLMAGLAVAAVALPLAMGFAIASGLKPENGLFTAIVAGFLISALGGSRVQIGGPAGAFIVVVYSIIDLYGVNGLLVSTIIAGILLFLMGLFRLGTLVRFIPVSIVIGFTSGIAVLIALSQVKDFFGIRTGDLPADFFSRLYILATHLNTIDPATSFTGLLSLAIVFLWPKLKKYFSKKTLNIAEYIPGTIVALITGTLIVYFLNLPVETLGSRFGAMPRTLPRPSFPAIDWAHLQMLGPPAITIALLGAIESLLCARVADNIIKDRHNPNQELMAQGIANIAAPFMGGFCATGTIARTVTNARSGARSPVAGMIHSLSILIVLLFGAPLAEHIPLTTLSALLLYVAYNMGEWHQFRRLRHHADSYKIIFTITFLLTVIVNLTVAVEIGLLLAGLFFIIRMAQLTRLEPIADINPDYYGGNIEAYRLYGSLFFGAALKLEGLMDPQRKLPKVIILDLNHMLSADVTGLEAIGSLSDFLRDRGSALIVCNMPQSALAHAKGSGFFERLGKDYSFPTLSEALARAENLAKQA